MAEEVVDTPAFTKGKHGLNGTGTMTQRSSDLSKSANSKKDDPSLQQSQKFSVFNLPDTSQKNQRETVFEYPDKDDVVVEEYTEKKFEKTENFLMNTNNSFGGFI